MGPDDIFAQLQIFILRNSWKFNVHVQWQTYAQKIPKSHIYCSTLFASTGLILLTQKVQLSESNSVSVYEIPC